MIQKFSSFIKTGAGLEKTLRLIQCVSQVTAALTVSSALAVQLTTVKAQLALCKSGKLYLTNENTPRLIVMYSDVSIAV